MRCLLDNIQNNDIKVNGEIVCSDLNNDLINLWNVIKTSPESVHYHYKHLWEELNYDNNKTRKRAYFEEIRDRLNKEHNPLDFLFILRTTTNGMCRYNKKGEFNNSFHITRDGIKPETLKDIIFEWSELLNIFNVQFKWQSFENVNPKIDDLVFLRSALC